MMGQQPSEGRRGMRTILSFLTSFVILSYGLGVLPPYLHLTGARPLALPLFSTFSLCALGGHGYLLYRWIETGGGQNLHPLVLMSFFLWLMVGYICVKPRARYAMSIGAYPLAAASIAAVHFYPAQYILHTADNPGGLAHILLASLATSILGLGGLQACLLVLQSRRLHQSNPFWQSLAPLDAMERSLFHMLLVGWLFLSATLLTGLFVAGHSYTGLKVLFSLCAWAILALLLFFRFVIGYRGVRLVKMGLMAIAGLWLGYGLAQWCAT